MRKQRQTHKTLLHTVDHIDVCKGYFLKMEKLLPAENHDKLKGLIKSIKVEYLLAEGLIKGLIEKEIGKGRKSDGEFVSDSERFNDEINLDMGITKEG